MKKIRYGLLCLVLIFTAFFTAPLQAREQSVKQAPVSAVLLKNQPVFVDFSENRDCLESFSKEEQLEQIRDWLLFSVFYSLDIPEDTLTGATFDLPVFRSGYLDQAAAYEYGAIRSCYAGTGTIVALLPENIPEVEKKDWLAHIVDKHRKNLGEIPAGINLFEYTINLEDNSARLTSRGLLETAFLFTQANGYYETTVKSLQDFELFMNKTDDIVHTEIRGHSLILGGRKIQSRQYRNIRVEDVATIWQGEQQLSADRNTIETFNKKWQARQQALNEKKAKLDAAYAEELKELAALTDGKEFIFKEGEFLSTGELKKQFTEKWTQIYDDLQSGYDWLQSDYAAAEKQLAEDLRNARPVNSLGFSLDPVYDYAGLATAFSAPQFRKKLAEASSGCPEIAGENEFTDIEKALLARDILPFLKLEEKLKNAENPFCIALWDLELEYKFQAARYDGNLKGTEVGMVLFYTDLLAKLWTIDYLHCAPDRALPGFIKNTAVSLSPVYRNETKELSKVRIWFGAADSGFQFSSDKQALFFSRNTTRIYAASSNPLQPGKEVEVSMSFGAAIDWWNQHFEAVAQYEQEYERLNQIIKWSLVTSWLFENKQEDCLIFLADVPVTHTYRFPEWVNQRDLKFTRWDKIAFLADGYKGAAAEALPILHSYTFKLFDEPQTLYGGVSLASRDFITKRKPLIKETDDLIRRSYLDYGNTINSRMITLKGHAVTISENKALIQFNDKTRMRSRHNELLYDLYEKRIYYESDRLVINENLSSRPYNGLQISGDKSGLYIRFREKDVQLGGSLIRSLSLADDPVRFLQGEARISNAFRCGDDYYIDYHGSSSCFITAPVAKIKNDRLSTDFPIRGAAIDGKTPYAMNIIDTGKVNAVLKNAVNENAEITIIKSTKEFDHLYLKIQGKTSSLRPDVTDQEFEKCLVENQISRISRIDDSLINNKAYADREIADAMEQHGPLLDLCIRKAASQIKNGRTDQINITEVVPVPLRNPEAIKNLLGALNEMGDRNTVYAKNNFLLGKFAQWKDSEIRNAANSRGNVMLQHENNKLILTWQFNDKISKYKINPDTLDPAFPGKHPLYMAGKADPGTEFTYAAIQKMAQEKKIAIIKLNLSEVASNQPTLIYADGYEFRLQKEMPADSSESTRVTDDTIYLLIVKQ